MEFFAVVDFLGKFFNDTNNNDYVKDDDDTLSDSKNQHQQSLVLCIVFASISGIVRVIATMILAYPDFVNKHNTNFVARNNTNGTTADDVDFDSTNHQSSLSSIIQTTTTTTTTMPTVRTIPCLLKLLAKKRRRIVYHLILLGVAAYTSIMGTIYGPVGIAVPVQTGVVLLFNVIIMSIVLRMRTFNKTERVGTYVVVLSVISLTDVGPSIQENQNASHLLVQPLSIIWIIVLSSGMIHCAIRTIRFVYDKKKMQRRRRELQNSTMESEIITLNDTMSPTGTPPPQTTTVRSLIIKVWNHPTVILAMGTSICNVAMATCSKSFDSINGIGLSLTILYYIVASIFGILFSVVSSTECDQGIFTPLTSVTLLVLNMITGIIIWEDWKVITVWTAYISSCLLMCCGVYLLSHIDLAKYYSRLYNTNTNNNNNTTNDNWEDRHTLEAADDDIDDENPNDITNQLCRSLLRINSISDDNNSAINDTTLNGSVYHHEPSSSDTPRISSSFVENDPFDDLPTTTNNNFGTALMTISDDDENKENEMLGLLTK